MKQSYIIDENKYRRYPFLRRMRDMLNHDTWYIKYRLSIRRNKQSTFIYRNRARILTFSSNEWVCICHGRLFSKEKTKRYIIRLLSSCQVFSTFEDLIEGLSCTKDSGLWEFHKSIVIRKPRDEGHFLNRVPYLCFVRKSDWSAFNGDNLVLDYDEQMYRIGQINLETGKEDRFNYEKYYSAMLSMNL